VVEQLRGIGGAQPFGFGPDKVLSLPDALAKALERYLRSRGAIPANGESAAGEGNGGSTPGKAHEAYGDPASGAPASGDREGERALAHDPIRNGRIGPVLADLCPACGSFSYLKLEGCNVCRNCGHSTCSHLRPRRPLGGASFSPSAAPSGRHGNRRRRPRRPFRCEPRPLEKFSQPIAPELSPEAGTARIGRE